MAETTDQQAPAQSQTAGQPQSQAQTTGQTQNTTALSAFSDQLAGVVERAARSIVTVAARQRQSATGILWNAGQETIVLTADHVVEREDNISVTLPDKREVKAQLIGRDPGTDLAALRITGTDLGTSAAAAEVAEGVKVGNLVLAIGRPGADGPRVSFGAVSAIAGPLRSWQGGEIEGIIYADVTLYPGFSGGPLVDLAGRVVGLNSSHLTRQSSTRHPGGDAAARGDHAADARARQARLPGRRHAAGAAAGGAGAEGWATQEAGL